MKSNRTEIQTKKDGPLTKILGIMPKFEHALLKLYEKPRQAENDYLDTQTMKALLEVETRRSQAIEFSRRLQNH